MRTLTRLAAALLIACAATAGSAQVLYTVNGQPLDVATQRQLYQMGLPPGHYWLAQNGNWGRVGSNQVLGTIRGAQVGGSYIYKNPGITGGSGQVNRDGSWSHYNPLVGGGGVGGDGNGCFYANGWSNC